MSTSIAAPHAKGKFARDVIFAASDAAQAAIKEHGSEPVINSTAGVLIDDAGKLVFLPTVEKVFRSLASDEIVAYAPVAGLKDYLDVVKTACFGQSTPDAHSAAVATAGGTGAIALAIWNYTSAGDTVLTSDWYWGAYKALCEDKKRKLATYKMLTDDLQFNLPELTQKFDEILEKQDSLMWIINTPAHNPTGYSLSDKDWDAILEMVKERAKKGKNIIVFVDVAYLDFAGEKEASRKFFKKFTNLPQNVLILVGYSMSKSFTLYGQRTGALIALSNDSDVVKEFKEISEYSCRATWSNCNRSAMRTLVSIYNSPELLAAVEKERLDNYLLTKQRADIFTKEAKECGLFSIPYAAGFFTSMPVKNPAAVCEELKKDLIFAVPLAAGVRLAICSVPTHKISGLAAKIKVAIDKFGN